LRELLKEGDVRAVVGRGRRVGEEGRDRQGRLDGVSGQDG